jgi:hypothetical protein
MIRILHILMSIIIFVTLLGVFYGCTIGLPSTKNYELVKSGERAIVLLRITCEIDSKPYEVFHLMADWPILALGNFETGGTLRRIAPAFPSHEARKDGWMYLLLKPGPHYLAAQSPFANLETAPLWRFDVPPETGLVYVGTLHLPSIRRTFLSIPSGFFIIWESVVVRSEEDAARDMAEMSFPELETIKTVLMEPHIGPIIIRKAPGQ